MDCKYYQDLLIQLPYNELNQEETHLIENHLNSCEKCRAELEKNRLLYKFSQKLGNSFPQDENKQKNLDAILKKIESPHIKQDQQLKSYRLLRIVINAAAVFLIGLFLLQQMELRRNLDMLSSKVETQINSPSEIQLNDFELSSFLDDPGLLKQFNISEKEVTELINEYQSIQEEHSVIFKYLQNNYPEVYDELQNKLKESKFQSSNL